MKQIGRSTRLVRVPRETRDAARAVAACLPGEVTLGHVLSEGLRLQGTLLELLHAAGHTTVNISAGCLLEAFVKESEAAWQEGAGKALKELEDQTEVRARVRATELASAALPGLVEAATKALFESEGLPVPPISIGLDGALEIGGRPRGLVEPEDSEAEPWKR